MAYLPLPDGSAVTIRAGETGQQAWLRAQQMYPEAFGITPQHGFMGALKAGVKESVGAGIRGLGSLTGSEALSDYGQKMLAPDETPGAWTPTPDEAPGAMNFISRNVTEPLGGMIGRYAIPTAVGAGAAALAPAEGLFGLGAAGTAAAARGLGFVASDMPMEQGANVQEQERAGTQQPDQANTVMASLAQAALMPVLGHLGGAGMKYFKLLGPDLATTAQAVMTGQMTQDAAIASLNSTARNLLVHTGEAAAVGAPMMVGTEALRMGQAGEDVTGPEAMQRYGENLKAAGAFAPLGGVLGGFGRSAQVRALDAPAREWSKAVDMGRANDEALAQKQANLDAWNKAGVDTTGQLPLNAPEQPKQPAWQGAGPEVPTPPLTIDRAFFNKLGVPNGKRGEVLRAYEGTSLDDPQKLEDFKSALAAHVDTTEDGTQEGIPKWAQNDTVQDKLKAALALPELNPQIPPEQLGIKFPTPEETNAEQWDAKMAQARDAAKAAQPGAVRDMFTNKPTVVDQMVPEVKPIRTLEQYDKRLGDYYAKFLDIEKRRQETGDDTEMRDLIAQSEAELGPYRDKFAREGTAPMFNKKGQPIKERQNGPVTETNAPGETGAPEQGTDRTGNGEPIPGPGGPDVAAGAGAVGAGVLPDERPVVGEKPEQSALTGVPKPQDLTGWAGLVASPEQAKAEVAAKVSHGADIEQTVGPTGIGRAASPEKLRDLAPLAQRLQEAQRGDGGAAAATLWWNDLAWMQRNKDTDPIAQQAIEQGIAAKRFTQAQLDKAISVDDKNVAQQERMKRLTAKAVEKTDTADKRAKVKSVSLDEADEIDTQRAREETRGPTKAELASIAAEDVPDDLMIKLDTQQPNGTIKKIRVNAQEALVETQRLGKSLDAIIRCMGS